MERFIVLLGRGKYGNPILLFFPLVQLNHDWSSPPSSPSTPPPPSPSSPSSPPSPPPPPPPSLYVSNFVFSHQY